VRHQIFNFLKTHPLLDGPFHTHEADTVLVFKKLTDGTNPSVAKVVDVVDITLAVLQIYQIADNFQDILFRQDLAVERS